VVANPDASRKEWQIERCTGCNLGRTWPPPSARELAEYYPPAYVGDIEKAIREFRRHEIQKTRSWQNEVAKVSFVEKFVKSGRILDVGCGDGRFLWALADDRWKRAGLDVNSPVIEALRWNFPDIEFLIGDLFSPTLGEACYDAITLWHVLEHLSGPRESLARLHRLLRPGGWLFLSVPNFGSWQPRFFRQHWYAFDVPRHLYHYSEKSLALLLGQCGFELVTLEPSSRNDNVHQLKHSAIQLARAEVGSVGPYYLAKPFLLLMARVESLIGSGGVITAVARKAKE